MTQPRLIDAYPVSAFQFASLTSTCLNASGRPAVRLLLDLPHQPRTGPRDDDRAGALLAAWADVVTRYDALRTEFDVAALAGPRQLVYARSGADPVVSDLTRLDGAAASRQVSRWRAASWSDGERGDGAVIHRLPGGRLSFTADWAGPVLDQPSATVVAGELADGYLAGLGLGQPPHGAASAGTTRDIVAGEAGAASDAGLAAYWRPRALGMPGYAAQARPAAGAGASPGQVLPLRLREVAEELGVPLRTLLLASYLEFTGRRSGRRSAGVWLAADRAGAGGVGEFRSLVPILCDRDAAGWAELAGRVGGSEQDAAPGLGYPVVTMLTGEPVGGPVFEWREAPGASLPAGARAGYQDRPVAADSLTVTVGPRGGVRLHLCASTGDSRQELAGYLTVLREVASSRGGRASRPFGRRASPEPDAPMAGPGSVLGLIRSASDARPDAEAVVADDTTLTYRELWQRAGAIAAGLAGAPGQLAGPGSVLALWMPRSPRLVTAMLGVLLSGSAFLALDPDYPPDRSAQAIADSAATAVLSGAGMPPPPGFDGPVLRLDDLAEAASGTGTAPDTEPPPESAAYVLFTSGSTGRPKGVQVPHRALASLATWSTAELGIGPGDRVAQRTSLAFDAAIWEIFAPLSCGATVAVLSPSASRQTDELAAALRRHRVSVLQLVPSLLAANLQAGTFLDAAPPRLVLCGGEALHPALASSFAEQCGQSRLINVYGPAECTVDTVWSDAGPAAGGLTVPIGRTAPGVAGYVLDEIGEECGTGVPGQLFLGGRQLATGYRCRPGATADRFVPDHLGGTPGARLYRTGDRVRRLPGGELEFIGRVDRQVKIRGVRTELGEIESVLATHPAVRSVAVVAASDPAGGTVAHAFVAAADDPPPDGELAAALRAHAARWLPEPMLPAACTVLDELPMLPNGKADIAALTARAAPRAGACYRQPAGDLEMWLARTWAELLGLDAIGRDDDPAALGAGPLAALRLSGLAAAGAGVPVPPLALLSSGSIAQQAVALRARESQ